MKSHHTIPATYFDPDAATRNLVALPRGMDNGFADPTTAEHLPPLFRKMNSTIDNIKSNLRLNPDRCMNLLESVIGDESKFNTTTAKIGVEKSIIADNEQKSIVEGLINDTRLLRGFINKDTRYVGISNNVSKTDMTNLLNISSQVCFETVSGMTSYFSTLKEEQKKKAEHKIDPVALINHFLQIKKQRTDEPKELQSAMPKRSAFEDVTQIAPSKSYNSDSIFLKRGIQK